MLLSLLRCGLAFYFLTQAQKKRALCSRTQVTCRRQLYAVLLMDPSNDKVTRTRQSSVTRQAQMNQAINPSGISKLSLGVNMMNGNVDVTKEWSSTWTIPKRMPMMMSVPIRTWWR